MKINETIITLEDNPVDLEKGEVSEVERALEELEEKAFQKVTIGTDNKHRYLADLYTELREKAQNLVNALEAEKQKGTTDQENKYFQAGWGCC